MKKTLTGLLMLTLVIVCICALSLQTNAASSDYYEYEVSGGKATITGCDSEVTGALTIPSVLGGYPVTTIAWEAFAWCEELTSVIIPGSVTTIGEDAFAYCTSLTSVVIPDSVTTIGDSAFYFCYSLTAVTIGDRVTTIGENAFSGCDSLTGIHVDPKNTVYSSDSRGVLFSKNKTTLLQAPGGISGSYTIPGSVTTIGAEAFLFCDSLTTVTIGDSVTTIGDWAFAHCYGLKSVTIGDSVTTVINWAFAYCYGLTSVIIPDSVKTIGDDAFYDCANLTSVFIPSSVTTIGYSAFTNCSSLTDVYYGGSSAQWRNISIDDYNEYLTNAAIHYNTYRYFPDVKASAWYYGAVQFAVKKGYFSGNGDGTFGPGNNITRQDFVVVLSRIAGANLSKYSGKTSFTDVPSNAYYAKAIHWATDNGIIAGYNATKFGVGDALTREQLVTILSRYAAKKGVNVAATDAAKAKLNAYSDANKVNPYMKDAVAWALQNRVISGMTATTVGPQGKATRAQVAAILFNISSYKVIPGI